MQQCRRTVLVWSRMPQLQNYFPSHSDQDKFRGLRKMQSVAMGLKLLDGTIVDSSFTPMCFMIMANISRLLCMEVRMHKQVLDIFCSTNFSRSFWWPPTLFTRSGWYHLHCHFGSIAARWHRFQKDKQVDKANTHFEVEGTHNQKARAFSNRCERNVHRF